MSGWNSNNGRNGSNEGEDEWEGESWESKFSKVAGAAAATAAVAGGLYALLKSSPSPSGAAPEPPIAVGAHPVRTEPDDHGPSWSNPHELIGWSFPPHGWIKCNVDGSAPPGRAPGCGGVFRDASGCWRYGFARSLEACTSSAAELEAICTALDIAWDQGFHKLILETDSLTAADVVNKKDGASPHTLHEKKLVRSIRDKLEHGSWDVKIVHGNRESNKVADWLANLSRGLQVGDQIELSKLPEGHHSCQKLVEEDVRLAKTKARRSNWFS